MNHLLWYISGAEEVGYTPRKYLLSPSSHYAGCGWMLGYASITGISGGAGLGMYYYQPPANLERNYGYEQW